MKKSIILLLMFMILFLVSSACGDPHEEDTVQNYPVYYAGGAEVSRFASDWPTVVVTGQAEFVQRKDGTCTLHVTYPDANPIDEQGGLSYTGDTLVYTVDGNHQGFQNCWFHTCNGTSNFKASGRVDYSPGSASGDAKCADRDNESSYVTLSLRDVKISEVKPAWEK